MKKNKPVKYLFIGVILFVVVTQLFFKKKGGHDNVYSVGNGGYTASTYIDGISFEIPEYLLADTFSATVMSETDDTYLSGSWMIKSGNSSFKLFSYNNFVVLAEKGTSFRKEGENPKNWISEASLNGSWFALDDDFCEQDVTDGIEKTVMTVVGDVSINPQFYGPYAGRLAILYDGTTEWTLFAGISSDLYEKLEAGEKDFVCNVAGSLTARISATPSPTAVPTPEVTAEPEPKATEPLTPDATPTPTSELIIETPSVTPTETVTPTEAPTPTPDTTAVTIPKDIVSDATVENPLSVGQAGIISALGTGVESETFIRLEKIITGKDAVKKIKKYCKNAGLTYEEAPAGEKWQIAEFTTGIPSDRAYIESSLNGLDGGLLVFNGVENPTRTHDMFTEVTATENGYTGYCIYYPVPNGCEAYLLTFGNKRKTFFKVIN